MRASVLARTIYLLLLHFSPDVFVDVPDEIDISDMRSSGPKPDEQLLPETPDPAIMSQLAVVFPSLWCEKAALQTQNSGFEEAMDWLLAHVIEDPDIDEPITRTGSSKASNSAPGGDTERAAGWILNHPEESVAMELDVGTGNRGTQPEVNVADGSRKYQLLAFVSHMGTSTQSGHYVAHVRKNDRWVIFNDCKVALSVDPPRDKGYLYFFQRIPSENMNDTTSPY